MLASPYAQSEPAEPQNQQDKADLPKLNTQIKKQQSQRHVVLWKPNLRECTRETHAMQQSKAPGQPPRMALK
jgi:hypothetical protein